MDNISLEDRPMRGLWRCLLWHTLRSASVAVWGVLFLVFVFLQSYIGDIGIVVAWSAFYLLIGGVGFVQKQAVRYPLLGTLPVTRRTRARLVWLHQVAVVPTVYGLGLLICTIIVVCLKGRTSVPFISSNVFWSAWSVAIASPAIAMFFPKRIAPSSNAPSMDSAVPALIIGLSWYGYRWLTGQPTGYVPEAWLVFFVVLSVSFLVLSFVLAERLLLSEASEPTRFPWRRAHSSGPRRSLLSPLAHMVLVEPSGVVCPFLAIMYFSSFSRIPGESAVTSLCGVVTFMMFMAAGMRIHLRLRVMLQLPLSRLRLAGVVMEQGLIAPFWLLVFFMAAGHGEISVAALASAVLLGVCVGSFGPVYTAHHSGSPNADTLYILFGMIVARFSIPFHWVGLGALPFLAVAAPLCVLAATLLLRRELNRETSYQYRPPSAAGAYLGG